MRLKVFAIILLVFQVYTAKGRHETIEEYLNRRIEVIRRITGSYQDQMMSESEATPTLERFVDNPLECVGSLKMMLKNRLPYVISSDRSVKTLKNSTFNELKISNKKKLRAGHAKLSFSKVDKVLLPFVVLSTPKQLNEELVATNIQISELKSSMNRTQQLRADETGPKELENVKATNLVIRFKNHPFEDALISSKTLILNEEIKLKSMSTSQLTINGNRINKIPLDKLLNSTSTRQVTGEKSFKQLTVNELDIDDRIQNIPKSLFKQSDEAKLNASRRIEFQGDINVKHLKVKAINRLNLTAFMSDVLLKGDEIVLNGNLIAESLLNVENLKVNLISKIPTANFMTVNGDQSISSEVFISKFYTSNINSPIINGEEISSATIATINSPNIITPKTRFMDISVIRNLNVEGVQGEETKKFVDMIKRHVIGTQTSDLFQLYNGHVIIQGSLKLHDVQFKSIESNLFVGNSKIFQNLPENYWMKSIKQNILAPNFVIDNEVLAGGNVIAASLNNHLVDKYLIINSERPQGTVWLRFEDVFVKGDVKGHKSNEPSKIFLLSATAVPRNSQTPIEILGNVEFRNELVVKRLRAGSINSNAVNSLVNKNMQVILMEAPVKAGTLSTSSLIIDRDLSIDNYNNVDLLKLSQNILKLSLGTIKIDSIIMDRFEALNLNVDNFEGLSLDQMVTKLQKEFDTGAIRERILSVHGDVTFNKNIFVERLNSETIVNEFFSSLAFNNQTLKIGGKKAFEYEVTAEILNSDKLNRLLSLSLSRGVKQTFKNSVTINNLNLNALHANYINDDYWSSLVSKKHLDKSLLTNLQLDELIVNDLTTNFAVHDLSSMIQAILFPKRISWSYINVTKEVSAALSPSSELHQLFTYAVDKKSPQSIFGKVNVLSPKFYIKSAIKPTLDMNTRTMAINLHQLIHDSVKNYAPQAERIYGTTTILRGNRVDANNLFIDKRCSFFSSDINGIDIMQLNKTLFRGGNLTGSKVFNYLHVDDLKIKGNVNGIYPRDIITINSNVIYLYFEKLEVKELHTYSVNGYSFQYFLDTKLRKHGNAQVMLSPLMMKSAEFEKDTTMPIINDVNFNYCVFSKSHERQDFENHLIVNGKVKFIGPVYIIAINGEDFQAHLKDSVSRHEPFSCNKLTLNDVELKNGLKINGIINKREIRELLESDAHSPKLVDLMSLISHIQKQESVIDSKRNLRESRGRMMYLDTDDSINDKYKMLRNHDESDEKICSASEIEFEPHAKGLIVTRRVNLKFEMKNLKAEVILPCSINKLEVRWNYRGQNQFNQTFDEYSGITANDFSIFETPLGDNFIIIKFSSSIIILKLDKSSHKWMEVTQEALSSLKDVRIISIAQTPQLETYLIVLRENTDDIFIYKFNNEFEKLHKITPNTKFDLILSLNVAKSSTFLIFARINDRKVFIYRLNSETQKFVFQQLLDETLDDIVSVIVLDINDEPFIVISKKSGVFCFYQWRGIENWQQRHCGKFRNLQLMKSFVHLNKQRIFLSSSINSNVDNAINALVIHKQGSS